MIAVAWVVVRNLLQRLCIPLTQDELWLCRAGPAGALVTQPNLKPDAVILGLSPPEPGVRCSTSGMMSRRAVRVG